MAVRGPLLAAYSLIVVESCLTGVTNVQTRRDFFVCSSKVYLEWSHRGSCWKSDSQLVTNRVLSRNSKHFPEMQVENLQQEVSRGYWHLSLPTSLLPHLHNKVLLKCFMLTPLNCWVNAITCFVLFKKHFVKL